jgi:hypothetical protein
MLKVWNAQAQKAVLSGGAATLAKSTSPMTSYRRIPDNAQGKNPTADFRNGFITNGNKFYHFYNF